MEEGPTELAVPHRVKAAHIPLRKKLGHIASQGLLVGLATVGGAADTFNSQVLTPFGINPLDVATATVKNNFDLKESYLDIITKSKLTPARKAFLTHYLDVLDDLADVEGKEKAIQLMSLKVLPKPWDVLYALKGPEDNYKAFFSEHNTTLSVFDYIDSHSFIEQTNVALKATPQRKLYEEIPENVFFTVAEKQQIEVSLKQFPTESQYKLRDLIARLGQSEIYIYDDNDNFVRKARYSIEEIEGFLQDLTNLNPTSQKELIYTLEGADYIPKPGTFSKTMHAYVAYFSYIENNTSKNTYMLSAKSRLEISQHLLARLNLLMNDKDFPSYHDVVADPQNIDGLLQYSFSRTQDALSAIDFAFHIMINIGNRETGLRLISNIKNADGVKETLASDYSIITSSKLAPAEFNFLLRWGNLDDFMVSSYLPIIKQIFDLGLSDLLVKDAYVQIVSSNPKVASAYLATYLRYKAILGDKKDVSMNQAQQLASLAERVYNHSSIDLRELNDFNHLGIKAYISPEGIIFYQTGNDFQIVEGLTPIPADVTTSRLPLMLASSYDNFISIDQQRVFATEGIKTGNMSEVIPLLREYDFLWTDAGGTHYGKLPILATSNPKTYEDLVKLLKSSYTSVTRVLPVTGESLAEKNRIDHLSYLSGSNWAGKIIIKDKDSSRIFETYDFIVPVGVNFTSTSFQHLQDQLEDFDPSDEEAIVLLPDAGVSSTIQHRGLEYRTVPGAEPTISIISSVGDR